MKFTKATKASAKLRAALFGPSGSGKTFTALRIATGLGGAIAVIDTERGSASKYADRFDFDVLELKQPGIPAYREAIQAAAGEGYPVLIIDSLSHGWQDLLQEIDRLANAKFRGNTWSAWSEGTPKQRSLVDAILSYSGHVIATMRSKTEWSIESSSNGKQKPVRVGLAPEQGKGIEYEFDLLMELSTDHIGHILKDRTGKFQDALFEKPDEDFGRTLGAWLSDGVALPDSEVSDSIETPILDYRIDARVQELGLDRDRVLKWVQKAFRGAPIPESSVAQVLQTMQKWADDLYREQHHATEREPGADDE